MSAVNLDLSDGTDGRNTESRRNTVDATKIAPDSGKKLDYLVQDKFFWITERQQSLGNSHVSESQGYLPEKFSSSEEFSLIPCTQLTEKDENGVPHSTNSSITSPPFHQGKVPFHHACCTNGCGAPQASVRRQQPQASGKRRIGSSTTSVCTNTSKKSCKSTASQIQEVAGDDHCAHCALACLFCEFMSLCSLALDCGGCGGCLEACCSGDGGESLAESCCGEAGGGNCPCGLGCGMLQDCCSSSDCLEICLECCSICFPA